MTFPRISTAEVQRKNYKLIDSPISVSSAPANDLQGWREKRTQQKFLLQKFNLDANSLKYIKLFTIKKAK